MTKRLLVLALLMVAVGTIYAGMTIHRTVSYSISFTTDTLADTASGDGLTNVADTFGLFKPITWNTVMMRAIIHASPLTARGIGLSDSVYWRLQREHWGTVVTMKADSDNQIPDTFIYIISGANDTVLRGDWRLIVETSDTTTDTVATGYYPVEIEYEAIPIEQ